MKSLLWYDKSVKAERATSRTHAEADMGTEQIRQGNLTQHGLHSVDPPSFFNGEISEAFHQLCRWCHPKIDL